MKSVVITPMTRTYTINTPVYEGPLDLLLHLIERAELDITRLALAQVTDQFLAHLQKLTELSTDEVSSFLVIATRLIQIKSEVLLPRIPQKDDVEEDFGEALIQQLIEYKQYKMIAEHLLELQISSYHTYLRLVPYPTSDRKIRFKELFLDDIINIAQSVFTKEAPEITLDNVISIPKITLREKVDYISNYLRVNGKGFFHDLLNTAHNRLTVVVTFLAILELIKRQYILAKQNNVFGEIEIIPQSSWDENEPFDLEFGE